MTVGEHEVRSNRVGDPILEVRDATVTFGMDRGESRVLDSVSLDIERNEVLGVVGESGSGKSMFASALLDAVVDPGELTGDITYRPGSGETVDVLDLDTEQLRRTRWEEISMVFQGAMSSFNPTMDVREHVRETLDAHNKDFDSGFARMRELLDDLYLDPDRVLDSYPHELSGGMQQRALIALSLLLEPEVLVMDEPTAALDLLMQRSILKLFEELKAKYDLTLVFITHDLPLVADLADRLAVMYAFEFIEIGSTDEILEGSAHPYTRALLRSTPSLEAPIDEMDYIEGSAPDPVDVPEGCSYHPRCPLADEQCVRDDPPLEAIEGDHRTACFYPEAARDQISTGIDDDSVQRHVPEDLHESAGKGDRERTVLSMDDLRVHFESSSGFLPFFGDTETVRAVDGVDLDIYENDVIALVGESGCGKTTLGKTAIGLQRPTEGSVSYRGQDVWESRDGSGDVEIEFDEIRQALQIIHQDPGSSLNPYRRVIDSLDQPLRKWRDDMTEADRHRQILDILERVGMDPASDYAQRFPYQLSGGEKQRVALVRALLMEPDLILADEAVSALDVSLRVEMMDLFLETQDEFDTSYIFISHDLSNARYLTQKSAGRIAIMYLGEIVEIGTAEQIIHDPRHPYTEALRWATPNLRSDQSEEEIPLRGIDIPDPTDPPSGCRFHTRCPEAREVCTREMPPLERVEEDERHAASCFREFPDHEYWDSEPIDGSPETDDAPSGAPADD